MPKEILYRKVWDLKKLKSNPRTIKDDKFKDLCRSIKNDKEYFEARPLLLSDRTWELIIISWNQRYEASLKIWLKEVPSILISWLTEERERKITLKENLHSWDWDYWVLADDWSEEELDDAWFDKKLVWEKDWDWDVPEIEFTSELLEKNNYVVLMFDNEVDWLNLKSVVDLPTVKNLWWNWKGVWRVIDWSDFINKFKKWF